MNEIRVFENEEFGQVRTVSINGEPWFVGKDVAAALGYEKPTDAARKHVDDEDKGVSKIETPSGNQQMIVINESGLYSLIFGSKLDSAKRFKHWVTSEVLPTLRKTGHYEMPSYEKKATSVGEVTNILKLTRQSMKERGCSEGDIARAMDKLCSQFGIRMPEEFLEAPGRTVQQEPCTKFEDLLLAIFRKS